MKYFHRLTQAASIVSKTMSIQKVLDVKKKDQSCIDAQLSNAKTNSEGTASILERKERKAEELLACGGAHSTSHLLVEVQWWEKTFVHTNPRCSFRLRFQRPLVNLRKILQETRLRYQ